MSSLELKVNNKPNITKIHFAIDDPLSDKIAKYELPKEFLNRPNTTVFIGSMGSGKTSLMINILTKLYKKVFHHIYVFMPHTSRKSLDRKVMRKNKKGKKEEVVIENIFDRHLNKENIYEELNYETVQEVYGKVKANSENDEYSLIIYDDVQKSLKDYNVLLSLKNLIANQRHLRLVNLILLQNYFSLDKSIREIANNLIIFKMAKPQMLKIFNEAIELHKDKFDDIKNFVYDDPTKKRWLFINVPTQRIFREWDEILIKDTDDDVVVK
jgi:thymidine kinase